MKRQRRPPTPSYTSQTSPVMHSWRDDTEKAIGQKVNNTILIDDGSRAITPQFSGTDTPTTLVAHQHKVTDDKVPDEETADTQVHTVAALDDQVSPPTSGKVADKNPFGLKPEYKTALRDFFVCLT
jgi:hypothetical protein